MNHFDKADANSLKRVDMTDWIDIELNEGEEELVSQSMPLPTCDWCGEPRGKGYMMLDHERCDALCTYCWGQSASYQTLREQGLSRSEVLVRLGKHNSAPASTNV
ncbi:MAG: hypothetical protein EOO38_19305 [Cytophagaceae bacterium]|nr:MAG: hypothetical protein EOO38_19305 [Cytophagaceae bacterium]